MALGTMLTGPGGHLRVVHLVSVETLLLCLLGHKINVAELLPGMHFYFLFDI